MSDTTNNWELGVVSFFDSFENYDRFTTFESDFTGGATTVYLNSDLCSDYNGSPYYLSPSLQYLTDSSGAAVTGGAKIPGSEIILGPSSDSTYKGYIEKGTIYTVDTTPSSLVTLKSSSSQTFIATPNANYSSGDQILIRTVPLGWTPNGTTMSAWGVMPIRRYDTRWDPVHNTIPGIDEYEHETQYGVRMYMNDIYNTSSSSHYFTTHYIEKYGDVNSFNPRVQAYRMSFYYRLMKYIETGSAISMPTCEMNVKLSPGEATLSSGSTLFSANTEQGTWAYKESYITGINDYVSSGTFRDTGENVWCYNGTGAVDSQDSNQANRWLVRPGLTRGINTAFDVDDLVIEHAFGTSQEDNGFYSINDYPDPSTIVAQQISTWKRSRLANGALKIFNTNPFRRDKYIISAEFMDVSSDIYKDLSVFETWNKQGSLIALRTKIEGLPKVMVGILRIKRIPVTTWDLSLCSFTLEFEEA